VRVFAPDVPEGDAREPSGERFVEAGREDQAPLALPRAAFFAPLNAASFSDGLALNFTVAPALTCTFSPVFGFIAVRFGVSRTAKEPNSGREKRPVVTISFLIAATMFPARRPAATPFSSEFSWMTWVRSASTWLVTS
jgi:hypothetical protein